jgi:hypothetical protein
VEVQAASSVERSVLSRWRKPAWLALALLLSAYVWVCAWEWSDHGFFAAELRNLVWGMILLFVFLPWLLMPAPLIGVWLLFDISNRGAGRWAWRVWVGGLLTAGLIPSVETARNSFRPNVYVLYHPVAELAVVLAAIPLVGVVTYRSRRR